ncbi:MAG TPA: hypothetical protein VD978_25960 [Azospirillum sp.]|nr:hypothetical protein [Azospirillum sp.]
MSGRFVAATLSLTLAGCMMDDGSYYGSRDPYYGYEPRGYGYGYGYPYGYGWGSSGYFGSGFIYDYDRPRYRKHRDWHDRGTRHRETVENHQPRSVAPPPSHPPRSSPQLHPSTPPVAPRSNPTPSPPAQGLGATLGQMVK